MPVNLLSTCPHFENFNAYDRLFYLFFSHLICVQFMFIFFIFPLSLFSNSPHLLTILPEIIETTSFDINNKNNK